MAHSGLTTLAVFVCFVTKAVRLEIMHLLANRHFVSRRGNCRHLYFVGARNQLEKLRPAIYSKQAKSKINNFSALTGTEFHFIQPRAPHFGGLWEATVKFAKNVLPGSVKNNPLTYEELETVVVQIETILNSRAITPMSADPNELTAVTPPSRRVCDYMLPG